MDTYQAVYDAVRSRFSGCDTSDAIYRAAYEALDVSHAKAILQQEIAHVGASMTRPSVLFRPRIFPDGKMWCALLGADLAEGIAGFGDTPEAAAAAFDKAFYEERTPAARLSALSTSEKEPSA